MCKFIKNLVKRDFGERMDISENCNHRQFEPIRIGSDLWLSIQASYAHYCKPRKTIEDLEEYTHWEIALFTKDDFVNVSYASPEFSSLAELELYFQGSVYPCVPKDLVEELYLALV